MNDELNFKLNVEPAVTNMMEKTEAELAGVYGIPSDDFRHAIFNWVMDKLVTSTPLWMVLEYQRLAAMVDERTVIEGEAV